MIESAGAYGPWFEWKRFGKSKSTRGQLLALDDQNLVDKDPKLYLERFAYRKECQRIFQGLSIMNYATRDGIAIRVNTSLYGDGLILRETFEEENLAHGNSRNLTAFLVTENVVFKVGPLTPKALEKAEKAQVDWRLSRLALVNGKIRLRDIFLDDQPEDAELLGKTIRESVETAKGKVGLQEYAASLVRLN